MKKLLKLLPLAFVLSIALSLSACAVGITCISHIDRDANGKCDNCGQTMAIVQTNVETLVIKTKPDKLYYSFNEKLDITGGVLAVTYNDGTPDAEIPFSDEAVTVTAPGMDSAGQKNVAVAYGGKTVMYVIEVGDARFTVTFDLNYEGAENGPSQAVVINGLASAPEIPARDGWSLIGWYKDKACTQAFDFAVTPITADITLYAGWTQSYTVIYDANYEGGRDITAQTVGGKADSTVRPDAREGFVFAGWYTDAACTQLFAFDTEITKNTTLYARWVSGDAEIVTVTFDYNYAGAPAAATTAVPSGSAVARPAAPSRASVSEKGHQSSGFRFGGWYTDKACGNAYDFSKPVNANLTLYAKWTGEYVFEAEHVNLVGEDGYPMEGSGASGPSVGPNMVDSPSGSAQGINASNGYYVTYLYKSGIALNFEIESDREVSDAKLVFRITTETLLPIAIDPVVSDGMTDKGTRISQYVIMHNNEEIMYDTIEIADVTGHENTGGWRPFSDFTIAVDLTLQKGKNTFTFLTANENGLGGTRYATAPVVDCIKITTSANLGWTPVTSNEFGQ